MIFIDKEKIKDFFRTKIVEKYDINPEDCEFDSEYFSIQNNKLVYGCAYSVVNDKHHVHDYIYYSLED